VELHRVTWHPLTGWSAPLPSCDGPGTLVMAYGAPGLVDAPSPLRELAAAYPRSVVVGCSTAGEIVDDAVSDDGLVVAVARFATTRLHLANERVRDAGESYACGQTLGRRLLAAEPALSSVLVLSDGLLVNGSALVSGLVAGTGGGTLVSGGLAGDGTRFGLTWVLVDGQPRTGYVSGVGFAGAEFRTAMSSHGGWDIFGPERRITRSAGNVLYELDGQPALALYKKYLGDQAAGLPATALLFPLTVRMPQDGRRPVVRSILGVDEQTQSMTFAGDVPEGACAQLMRASLDRLVDGAQNAGAEAGGAAAGPTLAIAVSCIGRRLVLGRRTEDELEAAFDGLPDRSALVGFYSYGEIISSQPGTCDLQNQTMTLTTLWEAGRADE
jgi:hypothetical protein